jgi:hypothetical protein
MTSLIVIAVFLIAITNADRVVNACTGTGNCRFLASCVSPPDINSCIVVKGGVNYNCSSPPTGYSFSGLTCHWTPECTDCRSNGRFSVPPDCFWNKL